MPFGRYYRFMSDSSKLQSAPPVFPDTAASFVLAGPAGRLEVVVDVSQPQLARMGTGVLCHPHPMHGGTMHNKVVTMLERTLRESGLDTVRFNFRGVGHSEGEYDNGYGEGADLTTVANWVRQVHPDDALWLAGFSFGSYVSIAHARQLDAAALISIAPPVSRWPFDALADPGCPWLIVQGEQDEVVDPQAVYDLVDRLEDHPLLLRIPDTGHFFHRRLMDLRGGVRHAVRDWLPPLRTHD